MAYVETPRTDAGNATYMSNAHNLENFSVENSFLSPSKSRDDLLSQSRTGRGLSLKTPRSRVPFTDRQNLSKAPLRGEFTPLLKSAARNSMLRKGQRSGAFQTPAFLKAGYHEANIPALPATEISGLYGDDTGSSVGVDGDGTPVPHIATSSAQSTPLAVLPKPDAGGVLTDQGNLMTLREQENIINKIEKENFGLKLKIHFLGEALRKAGPGFNEAAMKENTELKVDRVTLQKELSRAKKTLSQAEREMETYRRHLQEVQENLKRKHMDEGLRKELEALRSDVAAKSSEVQNLKERLESVEGQEEELERAKNNAEDLEAELRERDRLVDERDDEVERLQAKVKNDSEEMAELREELDVERRCIQDLENGQKASIEQAVELKKSQSEVERVRRDFENLKEELQHAKAEVEDAKEDVKEAVEARQKAVEDLEELQEELSNKSINTKGLSQQLEEKANKLQQAQSNLEELERSLEVERQHALDNDRQLRAEAELEINRLSEEIDNLHRELEDNDRQLRAEAELEINRLSEEIDNLHRELEDNKSQHAADRDHWESQRRNLLSQKEKADEQAAGLQRTINKLQEAEGTLSGREMKLREALESEKQRFQSEEDVLGRQIQELHTDVDNKRQALDDLRAELSITKEELRVSQRDQLIFEEKVQELEDDVEVLQAELDDEIERASAEEGRLNNEIDDLRHKLAASSEGRDRELLAARQKTQRLEIQISGLESRLNQGEHGDDATAELSILQKDLAAVRAQETEFLQREATHKESIRDLKQTIARLERQLHEVEIARLAVNSPQQSVSGSARKDEIIEVRRQLADAHQQIKDSRTKSREGERELQRKLAELNKQAQAAKDADECERDHLELQLSSCRMQHDQQVAKAAAAEKNVARLRTRVANLEKDLTTHRQTAAGDLTMADERKDLHEMLKDAKLSVETLQVEISSRETLLSASSSREKELRAHIRRIREERNLQLDKSLALSSELEQLQGRYERAVDNFTQQQKLWEEERKRMTSGVRFANTSVSSVHAGDVTAELKEMEQVMREKEKRHEGELKGLANQIQWLKVMGRREESFRYGLIHGKQYLLKEIEMHNRYTKANLAALERMGIKQQSPYPPPPLRAGATELERLQHALDSIQDPATKRPRLKAVGLMLVAGARMKRLAGRWAAEKRGKVAEASRSVPAPAPDKAARKKEARWEGADRRKSFGGGVVGR